MTLGGEINKVNCLNGIAEFLISPPQRILFRFQINQTSQKIEMAISS
jgi:hypothetical protein